MLRGKVRKKRKKEQICKAKQRQIKKIYIYQRLTAGGKEQQEKQTKRYCRENNNRFKILKIKIIKKRKEKNGRRKKKKKKRKTPQNRKSPVQRHRFITTIKNVTEYTDIHEKKVKLQVAQPLFVTPWTLQSMEFSRPESWSGQPFPSPGHLPNPGIEPRPPALQADSLPPEAQGKPENSGPGSLSLLQGIFPTQELNCGVLHCRQILYQLSSQGIPQIYIYTHKQNQNKKRKEKRKLHRTTKAQCRGRGL